MRLIDAKFVVYAAECEFSEEDAAKVRWLISHIPTICAEPVKRGEWITSERLDHVATIRCSQCGTMYQRRFKAQYNFCPECGADMRGMQHG